MTPERCGGDATTKPTAREPAPVVIERDDVRVAASRTRCPFCHSSFADDEWVACRECLARHHVACWGENGACATCAATRFIIGDRGVASSRARVIATTIVGASIAALVGTIPFGCLLGMAVETVAKICVGCSSDALGIAAFVGGGAICAYAGGWVAYRLSSSPRRSGP